MYRISLTLLLCLCTFAAFTDLRCRKIPNALILAGIFLRITSPVAGFLAFGERITFPVEGLVSGFVFSGGLYLISFGYKRIAGRAAFGGGDIKLIFMCGLFLSFSEMAAAFVFMLLFSSCAGVMLYAVCRMRRLPFAPAVLFGMMTVTMPKIISGFLILRL